MIRRALYAIRRLIAGFLLPVYTALYAMRSAADRRADEQEAADEGDALAERVDCAQPGTRDRRGTRRSNSFFD